MKKAVFYLLLFCLAIPPANNWAAKNEGPTILRAKKQEQINGQEQALVTFERAAAIFKIIEEENNQRLSLQKTSFAKRYPAFFNPADSLKKFVSKKAGIILSFSHDAGTDWYEISQPKEWKVRMRNNPFRVFLSAEEGIGSKTNPPNETAVNKLLELRRNMIEIETEVGDLISQRLNEMDARGAR